MEHTFGTWTSNSGFAPKGEYERENNTYVDAVCIQVEV